MVPDQAVGLVGPGMLAVVPEEGTAAVLGRAAKVVELVEVAPMAAAVLVALVEVVLVEMVGEEVEDPEEVEAGGKSPPPDSAALAPSALVLFLL